MLELHLLEENQYELWPNKNVWIIPLFLISHFQAESWAHLPNILWVYLQLTISKPPYSPVDPSLPLLCPLPSLHHTGNKHPHYHNNVDLQEIKRNYCAYWSYQEHNQQSLYWQHMTMTLLEPQCACPPISPQLEFQHLSAKSLYLFYTSYNRFH